MRRSYRMLLAESDDTVAGVLGSIVDHLADLDIEVTRTLEHREAVKILIADGRMDVALIDLRLPDVVVPVSLEELAIKAPRTALVALTTSCEHDIELIRAGVSECVEVGHLSPQNVHRAITHAVERKGVERRMLRMADSDLLTGIGNRRQLRSRFEVLRAERARRGGELVGAIFNIDGFEEYNNRFGHRIGDEALRQLAMVLLEQLRVEDVVARLGGDEFALAVLDDSTANAEAIVRRVHRALLDAVADLPTPFGVSGGAAFAHDDTSLRDLLSNADEVLNRVRSSAPGTVGISPIASVSAA